HLKPGHHVTLVFGRVEALDLKAEQSCSGLCVGVDAERDRIDPADGEYLKPASFRGLEAHVVLRGQGLAATAGTILPACGKPYAVMFGFFAIIEQTLHSA